MSFFWAALLNPLDPDWAFLFYNQIFIIMIEHAAKKRTLTPKRRRELKALAKKILTGEKIGIENLKQLEIWKAEVIKEIISLIEKQTEGKNLNLFDGFRFVDDIWKFGGIMRNHKEIGAEFDDLDEAEKQELKEAFNNEFDIKDDLDEEFVERTNFLTKSIAEYIYWLVTKYLKAKKEQKA